MHVSHILLPVDGSEYSDNATDYTAYLASLTGARVTAVHCYEWSTHLYRVSELAINELKQRLIENAKEVVGKAAEKLQTAGIDHTTKTISGPPGTILTNLAKSGEFDLIVMGSHGHSDIAGLFLGSVTHKVLNTIYCPVIIVP